MAGLVKKFLASASVVGMSAIFGAPALAATFSPIGTDLILRQPGNSGFEQINYSDSNLNSVLQGDSSNPGGNVELGSGEGGNPLAGVQAENAEGATAQFTNLTENIYNDTNWQQTTGFDWFSALWAQHNNSFMANSTSMRAMAYGTFKTNGGFDLISDPNISYISEVADDIVVGLAGHFNIANRLRNSNSTALQSLAGNFEGAQMSEIFAYEIDGVTGFGWTDTATASGLADDDAAGSYSGNYEVVIEGLAGGYLSEDVPEPSTVLGLMAIGGLVAATKRKSTK